MSDVLLMSALKLSNPIQILIQMKTDNFPWLTLRLSLRFHDVLPGWNPEGVNLAVIIRRLLRLSTDYSAWSAACASRKFGAAQESKLFLQTNRKG